MNRLLFVCLFALAAPAAAQDPSPSDVLVEVSPGALTPTPEMWYYQQELRRRNNPQELVKARAQFRAEQRVRRIAALKWYGMSASRPIARPDNVFGSFSPSWVGNTPDPYQWRPASNHYLVLRPQVTIY